MSTKRAGAGGAVVQRRAKRTKTVNLVPLVVGALESAEALPADLRTVFTVALPLVLQANKVDRHAYEVEVVDQAEKALAIVQAAIDEAHGAALVKQNELIAPKEHEARTSAKQAAEAGLEILKVKLEANKESNFAARKAVHDAQAALKAAQKDSEKVEKEMQANAEKKTVLAELLANEFVSLKDTTSGTPAGKLAVQKLAKIGKQYHFDSTLLQTFPLTCKKEPALRSDFETMMFTTFQAAVDREIDGLTQKLAEVEPSKADKLSVVASAQAAVTAAEAALATDTEELKTTQAATTAATKEVSKADANLYKIWGDMKEVCDAQDDLAEELKNFKENILTAFQQLKEKEPEPEQVEEEEADAAAAPEVVEEKSAAAPADASAP